MAHRIHLRGPWDYEWLEGPHPLASSIGAAVKPELLLPDHRLRMPADWFEAFGAVTGTVRFRRRFHAPTGLGPNDRVCLVCDGLSGTGTITVNSKPVGPAQQHEPIEITARLQRFNELLIELTVTAPDAQGRGGLWGPVALEIHAVE